MAQKLAVDFYSVGLSEDDGDAFGPIIERVVNLPNANKHAKLKENFYRLQSAEQVDGCWIGDIIKIRKDIAPIKADLDGRVEIIEMHATPRESGRETAFLYCPRLNALLLQRNRQELHAYYSPSILRTAPNWRGHLYLYPILDPGGPRRPHG